MQRKSFSYCHRTKERFYRKFINRLKLHYFKYFLLVLILIKSSDCICQPISIDSLKIYLNFNGNANDISGNSYNGVVNGAVLTTDRNNNPNSAYFFNGNNNSIVIPNITAIDKPLNSFTILITLQPQNLDSIVGGNPTSQNNNIGYEFLTWHRQKQDSLDAFLHGKLRSSFSSPYFQWGYWQNFMGYIMEWCSANISTGSGYGKDTSFIESKWLTVAYVYDNGSMKIYHNCSKVNDWPSPVFPSISDICGNEPVQISLGNVPTAAFQYGYRSFKGKISDFRFYTRALDETEINSYANNLCLAPTVIIRPAIEIIKDTCTPNKFIFNDVTNYTGSNILRKVWRINGDTSNLNTVTKVFNQLGVVSVRLEIHIDSVTIKYKDTVVNVNSLTPLRFLIGVINKINICEGGSTVLQVIEGQKYTWLPCEFLSNCSIANPTVIPKTNIKYDIEVVNNLGCKDTTTIEVIVVKDSLEVFVPTAFTPNNDGLNDSFGAIAFSPLAEFKLEIYNRWGQKVFNTTDIKMKWKPNYQIFSTGAFAWKLEYKTSVGCFKKIKYGTVMLIK